jgi:hypothetical protein
VFSTVDRDDDEIPTGPGQRTFMERDVLGWPLILKRQGRFPLLHHGHWPAHASMIVTPDRAALLINDVDLIRVRPVKLRPGDEETNSRDQIHGRWEALHVESADARRLECRLAINPNKACTQHQEINRYHRPTRLSPVFPTTYAGLNNSPSRL